MKKIIAFLMALVLSVGCIFSLTAFANEEATSASDAATPEIISQNVMYGGDFSLMFAVKADTCSGSDVTLSVYDEEPSEASEALWSKTISTASKTTDVKGYASYVFTTSGVAAKDMDKNYYIVAESAGAKSEVKRYSVAEYLYERLYDDMVVAGTSELEVAQTKLYKSALEVGKNAQNLLFNFDSDPSNDRDYFVTDLYYVSLRAENVFGVSGKLNDGKYSAYLMSPDEMITLVGSESSSYLSYDWNISYIDDNGSVTTGSTLGLRNVKPDSHMIITPANLANQPTINTFDNNTAVPSGLMKQTINTDTKRTTQVDLKDFGDGNKAARVLLTGIVSGVTSGYYESVTNTVVNKTSSTQKIVYEADITIPENIGDYLNNGDRIFYLTFRGASKYAYQLDINIDETNNKYILKDNRSNASWSIDAKPFNIRFDYFITEINGEQRFVVDTYINGEYLVKSTNYSFPITAGESEPKSISAVYYVYNSKLPANTEFYFDNLTLTAINPTVPVSEYYSFDGDTSIDPSIISFNSKATGSIVEKDGSQAVRIDWSKNSGGEVKFYPITVEENADKVIFEYTFQNNYAQVYQIFFYGADGWVYDFQFNAGVTLTSEGNSTSWGTKPEIGTTNTIRFELYIVDGKLEIDVYLNGNDDKRSNAYGGKVSVTGKDASFLDSISHVAIYDPSSTVEGNIIIDNVRFSKLNTAD